MMSNKEVSFESSFKREEIFYSEIMNKKKKEDVLEQIKKSLCSKKP